MAAKAGPSKIKIRFAWRLGVATALLIGCPLSAAAAERKALSDGVAVWHFDGLLAADQPAAGSLRLGNSEPLVLGGAGPTHWQWALAR